MKATLLFVGGLALLLTGGCESDLPPNPNKPATFGNNQYRDEGMERPSQRADW